MANILVADDDAIYLNLIATTLLSNNHNVVCAKDGEEALRLHKSQTFDLIITDILMPNVDGIDLIIELKTCHSATPIIAMSGGGGNKIVTALNLQSASIFGVHSVLQKPFISTCFLDVVRSALED